MKLLCVILAALAYGSFLRVEFPVGVNMVESVSQDAEGMMWMGTTSGLFFYDGFGTVRVEGPGRTYSLVPFQDRLAIGTEGGLVLMDSRTRALEYPPGSPTGIRAIVPDADSLWLGTFAGLYSYKDGRFTPHRGPGNDIVYSLLDCGEHLYIGTYDGLSVYSKQGGSFRDITLPQPGGRVNSFVNALYAYDGAVLAGTEDGVFRYDPVTLRAEDLGLCRSSVKTFCTDSLGTLLIGTDEGLYTFDGCTLRHVRHEAGREDSLGNDIIWSIFRDRDGNIWLGTDGEVSLSLGGMPFTPVSSMTGSSVGNRFTSVLRDRRGTLWLGGSNGLIRRRAGQTLWYRVDNAKYPIAHNRIRSIYEDRDGDLWICTDGSIHMLEGDSWRRINLEDSTHTRNANWAYDIVQDSRGRMWIATSLGGVLIKDKAGLLAGDGVADSTVALEGGSRGMYAYRLAKDREGGIWCLFYDDGLRRFPGGEVLSTGGEVPSYIFSDSRGEIWIGLKGRVMDSRGRVYPIGGSESVLCIGEWAGELWVSTPTRCVAIDPKSGAIHAVDTGGKTVYSIWDDGGNVILGTLDGIISADGNSLKKKSLQRQVRLCGVIVGGNRVDNHGLSFAPDETNIGFVFSDLTYGRDRRRLLWKMEGIDSDWNILPEGVNTATFNNLDYGRYTLLLAAADNSGNPSGTLEVGFRIRHPWYLRWWAFLLYALAAAALALWAVLYYRMQRRLEREQEEKNAILDNLTRSPMVFSEVDVVDLVRRSFEDFRSSLPKGRSAVFSAAIPSCLIPLDEYRISTAIEHILSNAAEFSDGGIRVEVRAAEGCVEVSVSDDGPGISPEELPHVKERFYRGRRSSGSGIGLYLADVYARGNGGSLDIASEQGTTVTLTLPVNEVPEKSGRSEADERFLSEMTALIEARLEDSSFNVASLSEQSGLGVKLIYRKIKQLTGSTPVEYLRTLRLRRAAALIREGKYTVSEVMYMCGFTNSSYFSKCFQAEFGTTPRNFR